MIPLWLQAGLWGLLSGSALVIGAGIGYFLNVPQRIVASIMAFGSGVLISALSFELMEEAYQHGGFTATALGFTIGAGIFTAANWYLSKQGAKHRKRSGEQQPAEHEDEGSGLAIAVGALLDGIPESIVIGLSLVGGAGVSLVAVIAIFLSNLPEGLSSAAGMKKAERSPAYVFGIWMSIAIASGIAATLGFTVFGDFSPAIVAFVNALAAGAILAMLVDTMIPEAFETAHNFAGLATVIGFLAAFALQKLGG
ncbi:MAG: ZIP family zinc transporter [Acidobacteria bacterium]|jgi:ZIP family zinc transporter|nr:ZIP family zinc transporter [Acidobacteriota bacterium]MBA4122119.1 ZIP family zinc transporter [Acidobacteriota bacterium]